MLKVCIHQYVSKCIKGVHHDQWLLPLIGSSVPSNWSSQVYCKSLTKVNFFTGQVRPAQGLVYCLFGRHNAKKKLKTAKPFKPDTQTLSAKRQIFSSILLLSVLPRHVLLKVARIFAGVTALIAGVGLFSSVSAPVYFQRTRLRGGIVALITLERFLS